MHPSPYANPGSIGPPTKVKKKQESRGAIWGEEEISEHQHYEYSDPRPQPECVNTKTHCASMLCLSQL